MKSEPGMLSFAEAKAICPLFSAEEQDFNWPSSLPIGDIGTLQIPMDEDRHTNNVMLRHALLSALNASLRLGMLPYQTAHSASGKKPQTYYRVQANDFAKWLGEQGRLPSHHVQQWLKSTDKPEPPCTTPSN